MLESLLNKVDFRPAALLKQTLMQVSSCDTYEIFKSNFFYKIPSVGTSGNTLFIYFVIH